MAEVDYLITGPRVKWVITMMPERVSVLSNNPVRFTVAASSNGLIYDPTNAAASAAFLPAWGNPQPGDFHACVWDVDQIGTYMAQINPGPNGLNLPIGTYYAWLKIVDPGGDSPVVQVGELIVQ